MCQRFPPRKLGNPHSIIAKLLEFGYRCLRLADRLVVKSEREHAGTTDVHSPHHRRTGAFSGVGRHGCYRVWPIAEFRSVRSEDETL